jgi:hypothetical protein
MAELEGEDAVRSYSWNHLDSSDEVLMQPKSPISPSLLNSKSGYSQAS